MNHASLKIPQEMEAMHAGQWSHVDFSHSHYQIAHTWAYTIHWGADLHEGYSAHVVLPLFCRDV